MPPPLPPAPSLASLDGPATPRHRRMAQHRPLLASTAEISWPLAPAPRAPPPSLVVLHRRARQQRTFEAAAAHSST
eukprot:4067814-Prymnesium_polylepis.1